MITPTKYGLPDIPVGSAKAFHGLTPAERDKIKRSAHNYNERSNMFFTTRVREGVLYITRLR